MVEVFEINNFQIDRSFFFLDERKVKKMNFK